MPDSINGIPVRSWTDIPDNDMDWLRLSRESDFEDPAFKIPPGYEMAAGVVTREPDGRIWIVAPSNAFGGYRATFPKGRLDGRALWPTALIEAYEETGLRVRLVRHLLDIPRSVTYTRYYLAERVTGNPADMGWESQAVLLAPVGKLREVLNSPRDEAIIRAIEELA